MFIVIKANLARTNALYVAFFEFLARDELRHLGLLS
jgi:hypothetical protein